MTKPELSLLQQHCAYGVETGRKLGLPSEALTVIAQHHEYSDGTGYPKGLKGSDIFLLAGWLPSSAATTNLCNPVKQSAVTPRTGAVPDVCPASQVRHRGIDDFCALHGNLPARYGGGVVQ
ncbi:MAG: hypothetical protein IPO19_13350 [Rhodoferax sp.]|nr:hypothetical protein [Rhodoferax sp.]